MGTNTGTIMTLANSIIGVSVLAMPFCFKQCGIALSIIMLWASSLLSRLACHFLLKAAVMARRRNFEFLAFHTFGSTGKFAAELFIIGFLMGTCIAFFVVVGDLGPAIISKAVDISNSAALRPSVLIGLAVFVVLPLGLLRNVDSLASVCTVTIGFYLCLVLKVVSEAMPHLLAGDWLDKVHFWRPDGILQCIPIFSMALFCQTQLFEIYESMHNASLDRMNDVIRAAVNMCTGMYVCVGFFGYVAYCTQSFTGNIMMSFTPSLVSEIIKFGFVLSVAVSFPLVIFPCRASLYSLLFRRIGVPYHENVSGHIPEARFKCLTVFIICVALAIGLLIPNIELVLGLVGSTIGVLICVMFPAAAFICVSPKSSSERLLAQIVLFVGALILVLGTYATLYAAHDRMGAEVTSARPELSITGKLLPDNIPADIPIKLAVDMPKVEANVNIKKDVDANAKLPLLLPPDKNALKLPLEVGEKKDDIRQEPPVPIEPANKVVVEQSPVPQLPAPKDLKQEMPVALELQPVEAVMPEPEKKDEIKLTGEQVDQDAIKKEDDALAEAEKQAKDDAQKKDAELLRKLEEHEEEQMKLLQEQKRIVQFLQEHKKEIEREKEEKSPNRTNKADVDTGKSNKLLKESNKIVGKVASDVARAAEKVDKRNVEEEGENKKKVISPVIPVAYQKQFANSKPFAQAPKMVDVQDLRKSIPLMAQQVVRGPDSQLDGNVPAPQQANLLLDRLKGPPVPQPNLAAKLSPQSEAKAAEQDRDAKNVHREILQQVRKEEDKNKEVVAAAKDIAENGLRTDLHEREKRDIEEEIPVANVDGEAAPTGEEPREEKADDNCAVTEKIMADGGDKGAGDHVEHVAGRESVLGNFVGKVKSQSLPRPVPSEAPKRVERESEILVRNVADQPQVKRSLETLSKIGAESSSVEPVQNISSSGNSKDVPIVNTNNGDLIKTVAHLTHPELHPHVLKMGIDDSLRQGVLQQEAKPMKRDLKSVATAPEEDKSEN